MRIAIMADIHGNIIALDAVMQDIAQRGGVDAYWILGDVAALGPAPVEVLERLATLPEASVVRGNTERYVCTGDRPPPTLDEARADPSLLTVLFEVAGTFAWTQGAMTYAGWLEWLSALPVEFQTALPDGTTVLGVHAAPGRDDGPGFQPGMNDAELVHRLGNCDAGLVLVGHTHRPMDVLVNNTRVVNVGCVSNPVPPDLRAHYVVLEADKTGYSIENRRVDYDRSTVIATLRQQRHPGAKFIIQHMQGRYKPHLHPQKPSSRALTPCH
jgi:predicted phosphodiesterase